MDRYKEMYKPGEVVVICNSCEHFKKGQKCAAFDFIPDIILTGVDDHSEPLKGQKNNLVYKEIEHE